MTVLAIDAGTTAIKAAAVEGGGDVRVVERRTVPRDRSSTVDPDAFWATVADTAAAVVTRAGQPDAVAVTGQGDGLWAIDAAGEAVRPTHEWNSTAASEIVGGWEADGTLDAHYRATQTVLWPGANGPIWRWLHEHHPEAVTAVTHVFCAKDWVNYRLTGEVATDVTDASISFLELPAGRYSEEQLDRLGCSDLAERLAPIAEPGTRIGTISAEAARRTDLAAGTPVLMGCIDVVAMVTGSDLTHPGEAMGVIGTTAAALAVTEQLDTDGEPTGATLRLHGGERYLRVIGASSGASTLDWYLEQLGGPRDDRMERFWEDVAAGRPGPVMLPYLAGERAPFLAPDATGTIIGLTPSTTRADIARAVAAGVTFSLRHCLDAATGGTADRIVLTGGGAASRRWCQLVADALGHRVEVDDRPHAACEGVARIATGDPAPVRTGLPTFHPGSDLRAEYAEFVELGRRLRPIWTDLATRSTT